MTQESTSVPLGAPVQMYFFKIYANNDETVPPRDAPLFGNGRQQLHVTLKMAALDANGNAVLLTDNELLTLSLIEYSYTTAIPYSETPFQYPWWFTARKESWEYDLGLLNTIAVMENEQPELFTVEQPFRCLPDRGHREASTPRYVNCETVPFTDEEKALLSTTNPGMLISDYQRADLYVSTTSLQFMRIAVSIRLANNTVVRTNWNVNDDNGLGDGNGKFNSSIRAIPKRFPNLPDSAYGKRSPTHPNRLLDIFVTEGSSKDRDRVYEHVVNINFNGSIINVANANCPTLYADRGGGWKGGTSHTYYTSPFANTILLRLPPYLGVGSGFWPADFLLWELVPTRTAKHHSLGQIIIGHVLTGWSIWFYHAPYVQAAKVTEGPLTLVDVYGNEHRLKLSFDGPAYYNYLTLSKA